MNTSPRMQHTWMLSLSLLALGAAAALLTAPGPVVVGEQPNTTRPAMPEVSPNVSQWPALAVPANQAAEEQPPTF